MNDARLLERMWDGMEANFRLFSRGAPGNRWIELDGLGALVVPPSARESGISPPPRTSLVLNSVICRDGERLSHSIEELAAAYHEAGVRRWTVWTLAGDDQAARALAGAGFELAAQPTPMGRELEDLPPVPDAEAFGWTREGTLGDLVALIDVANGWEEISPWTHALRALPSGSCRVYTASIDGRPASALMIHDHAGDAPIGGMATAPAARGRGLAGGLLVHALRDARRRGCTTSTLQSTALAVGLYERHGYRALGALEGWERRVTRP